MFIGMIWRPTAGRLASHARAVEFWSTFGEIRYFDGSRGATFNRAASRNLAVRTAADEGYDRLIVTDADCIPDPAALLEAFDQADDTAVHLPYDSCRVFDTGDNIVGEFAFTCGGVYVTTPAAWFAVGGQDERFTVWAPEDMAFKLAHDTLLGPMVRHHGVLASLAHERDENRHTDVDTDPMVQLYRQYEHANGNVTAMMQLCFPLP